MIYKLKLANNQFFGFWREKRTMLAFILTMPGKGSWDGKWSGEGKLYCETRSLEKQKELEWCEWMDDDGNDIDQHFAELADNEE
ncbi:MAG: hypothetical protein IPJ03_22200 [Ignavibacteriales bacterium]|nr:hypothetical protein [Ignavibacteriales bacterium]